jgi:hypothetical protein
MSTLKQRKKQYSIPIQKAFCPEIILSSMIRNVEGRSLSSGTADIYLVWRTSCWVGKPILSGEPPGLESRCRFSSKELEDVELEYHLALGRHKS